MNFLPLLRGEWKTCHSSKRYSGQRLPFLEKSGHERHISMLNPISLGPRGAGEGWAGRQTVHLPMRLDSNIWELTWVLGEVRGCSLPPGLWEDWPGGGGPAWRAFGWGQWGELGDQEHWGLSGHQEGPGAHWHDSLAPLGKWRVLEHNLENNHKTLKYVT